MSDTNVSFVSSDGFNSSRCNVRYKERTLPVRFNFLRPGFAAAPYSVWQAIAVTPGY